MSSVSRRKKEEQSDGWFCWTSTSAPSLLHSHPDKQGLPGGQSRGGVLLHQSQGAEAELVDGLVRVQRREVCVHLAIILCDVEAVGVHVLTAERAESEGQQHRDGSERLHSLQFGFSALAGVLPADEADEVVNPSVGDGHHRHGVQLLLSHLHGEVDVYLLGGRRTDVTLQKQTGNV